MRSVRVVFEDPGVSIDIYPATSENAAYVETLQQLAHPHQLAMTFNKLSEEQARQVLAETYAKTVIVGSPDPGLASMDARGWEKWLGSHIEEFDMLVQIAQNPRDWERYADGS